MSISKPRIALPLTLTALLCAAAPARAEVIQLLDNTQVAGKILHYYDGVFQVETAGGTRVDVPRDKIKQITFKLPPPRAEFATPEKTFFRWNEVIGKGDIAKLVDCYALMYQGLLASQVGQANDAVKKMQKEIEGTKFQIKGSSTKGESATLKVARQKGDDSETGEIAFVRENGEWKMLPPSQ